MKYLSTVLATLVVASTSWSAYGQAPAADTNGFKFPHFTCYYIDDGDNPKKNVTIKDQFFEDGKNVKVRTAKLLCDPAEKKVHDSDAGASAAEEKPSEVLKCYEVRRDIKPGHDKKHVTLDDQFFKKDSVEVKELQFLCTPAFKAHKQDDNDQNDN